MEDVSRGLLPEWLFDLYDEEDKALVAVYRDLGPSAPPKLIAEVAVARGLIPPPATEEAWERLLDTAENRVCHQLTSLFGRIPSNLLEHLIRFTHREGPTILRGDREVRGIDERGVGLPGTTLEDAIRVLEGQAPTIHGWRLPPVIEHDFNPRTNTHSFTVYFDVLDLVHREVEEEWQARREQGRG